MTFDPTSVEVTSVNLPKDHCVQVPYTSKYVDKVTLFAKTWTKGHWPLDDLWPHICWGHMCDSTQGSLCPSPMGIHQCMWTVINLQITTYIHTHTTCIGLLRTTYYIQNEWSQSLFLNYVQARQKQTFHSQYSLYTLLVRISNCYCYYLRTC